MKLIKLFTLALFFFTSLLNAQPLLLMPDKYNYLPNSLYVTKQGNDTNDGSSKGKAFLTVTAAYAAATTGQTIVLPPYKFFYLQRFCFLRSNDPALGTDDIFWVYKANYKEQ